MQRFIKIINLIFVVFFLLSGCDETKKPGSEKSSDFKLSTEDNSTLQGQIESNTNRQNSSKVSFVEAFPLQDISNPESFLNQLIPGFKLGLTKKEIEKLLGEPNIINEKKNDWGERYDWIYENIKSYQLVATFNSSNQLVNFQLTKYLPSRGIIPKIINKPVPQAKTSLAYSELGFEELLLGAKIDDVLNRYGEPYKSYISYDEMYGYELGMVYQGITLHIMLENNPPYVQLMETNNLGIIETYRGISIGSTVDKVIEMYGDPAYDWSETGDLIYASEDYWFAINFKIVNGKVVNISIYEAS